MNDFKSAFRQFAKTPGFTLVAVLTLALAIGANTAIFSFVNTVLLRPLPYHDPERLVLLYERRLSDNSTKEPVAALMLGEWRKQSSVFEGLAARGNDSFNLSGRGHAEGLSGSRVSANMFSLLGVKPALGRDFLPDEETPGNNRVVLLSHELWQRRFGGDQGIVGQTIILNLEPHTVVGVMPPRTFFPEGDTQLWAPLAFEADLLKQRHNHNYMVYGRLKQGVTLAQAAAEIEGIAGRMAANDPESKDWSAAVYSYREILVGDSRRLLLMLLVAVGAVLLIGCVNIANLQLARATARAREFAVRSALGAGRWRIVRQLLAESLVLAGLGGIAGIFAAHVGLGFLVKLAPRDLPRISEGVGIDGPALGFAALITLVAAVIFGLVPAFQATKPAIAGELVEGSRGTAGRRQQALQSALVVVELALSLILLVGAGLMIRSLAQVLAKPAGFAPENLVTMQIALPEQKYPEQADRNRFFSQLHSRVKAVPGVDSAALVLGLPLAENQMGMMVRIPDAPRPAAGETSGAGYSQVSQDYFRTMGIPLLQGRDFSDSDRPGAPDVLVVDEAFVRSFKLGTNVVGRRITIGDGAEDAEIIGVVREVRRNSLEQTPRGEMYRAYRQRCWGLMSLVVRTARDTTDITRAIRAELDQIDREQPVENVRTMAQVVSASVARRRASTLLVGVFASAALLLAVLGLYGVLSCIVSRRTAEIGIRMALGARRSDVLGLVVKRGATLAFVGIAFGTPGALLIARVLERLLYEVKPFDPVTFAGVAVLLVGTALFACWLPALRAARVDPMVALRNE